MSDLERTHYYPNTNHPKPQIHRFRVHDGGNTTLQYNGHPCRGKTTIRRVDDKIYLTTAVSVVRPPEQAHG